MSSKFVEQVSETANVLISGVTDVASSVSHGVEEVVSSVSLGVGDVVHNVSAGMKRLMTSPPCEGQEENEIGITDDSDYVPPTPNAPQDLYLCSGSITSDSSPPCESPSLVEATASIQKELGISENYFSKPDSFEIGNSASIEELEDAIEKCKALILSCEEASVRRRALVHNLIRLRLSLERAKEELEVASLGIQIRQGHHLAPVTSNLKQHSTKQFCDKCTHVMWNVLHIMYKCSLCDYQCHGKCVKYKHRKCPSLKFLQNPHYITQICPEVGLSAQNYRCAECHNLITNKNVWAEPRLCDYSGSIYCPACHWNSRMISPARVVHNWDFEEHLVSQQAKQFLTYINNKPLLSLEEINPHLFKYVEELNIVKRLRQELILMKDYLRTCRMAQELRLLRRLEERQHFVDDAHSYSLRDLIDLNQSVLIPFLSKVHGEFTSHIRDTCEICKGKGFICELCSSEDIIFPFDARVAICKLCQACFHEDCFSLAALCPRCLRQSSRRNCNNQE